MYKVTQNDLSVIARNDAVWLTRLELHRAIEERHATNYDHQDFIEIVHDLVERGVLQEQPEQTTTYYKIKSGQDLTA